MPARCPVGGRRAPAPTGRTHRAHARLIGTGTRPREAGRGGGVHELLTSGSAPGHERDAGRLRTARHAGPSGGGPACGCEAGCGPRDACCRSGDGGRQPRRPACRQGRRREREDHHGGADHAVGRQVDHGQPPSSPVLTPTTAGTTATVPTTHAVTPVIVASTVVIARSWRRVVPVRCSSASSSRRATVVIARVLTAPTATTASRRRSSAVPMAFSPPPDRIAAAACASG